MGLKYHCGLCLIVIAVFIWVASAEITQRIFAKYRQPFSITYVGVSLMVLYLPIVALKVLVRSLFIADKVKHLYKKSFILRLLGKLGIPLRAETRDNIDDNYIKCSLITDEDDEPPYLVEQSCELHTWEIVKFSLRLAPIWFFIEYMSNLALANTSVASTTILTSTSGLFTLFFGALLSQDSINLVKSIAVIISMAGVFLTTLGKTWAPDELVTESEVRKHTITGDIYGLFSAMLYGLFTVLLKKASGSEGDKIDLQKLFGYIGLFTLVGFWWLLWPLNQVGFEPEFELPDPSTGEIMLLNGFVASFISDYIWAVSVVWTTPLVASLGMTLTIPLAMVADMLIHKRHYSLIYILGCVQVLAGFVLANISDKFAFWRNPS